MAPNTRKLTKRPCKSQNKPEVYIQPLEPILIFHWIMWQIINEQLEALKLDNKWISSYVHVIISPECWNKANQSIIKSL